MSARILKGKPVADSMQAALSEKAHELRKKGIIPKLCIIRVGERSDDIAYETGAVKKMTATGIEADRVILNASCTQEELEEVMKEKNSDEEVHGILMLRPLPAHLDEKKITQMISPEKDVDCMNPATLAGIFEPSEGFKTPCTPQAVIEMLRYYDIEMTGKKVAVLGRSSVIGKPVALLLLNENATVTICHSKTADLRETVREADIVISAMGRAKMIDGSYIREGATLIDVGINTDEDGKLCGDADFESAEKVAGAISPVPGGVGSVTTTILAKNLLSGISE
ncbi:MAG: bifunctional 5,10-methylenetetrahydrofolate dehydrogenase/5,10-methenyltetrahydrofolate cyclohydrolase [Proteocatella sp.]|jgi:methylenetetrahydrofolate dehydrogenase (NADP+)/methenyltetrahydrofolate cyclohydrolase|nr:bifunctional 5,10-methylenetetrahydrofolate dehydrogenase/5,10-methenyltetrahydrofolate cyclohydrolase [Proteocatella sp.]MBP8654060.1 bifunctional 5,10-methylenetetrahydrofolate dehydrogenase/5,10-methenyltetrahydrofolate cyclohydrolase [Proteocatella sp.]MBP9967120.1 bifunctional 5,10-methylenetetrahydrofolate dehydrogenase/5,10-methenyltetrahydrofolate cyclohydrolase [Proteocatella sp.]